MVLGRNQEQVGFNKVTRKQQKKLISFLTHNFYETKILEYQTHTHTHTHRLSTYYAYFHKINQADSSYIAEMLFQSLNRSVS